MCPTKRRGSKKKAGRRKAEKVAPSNQERLENQIRYHRRMITKDLRILEGKAGKIEKARARDRIRYREGLISRLKIELFALTGEYGNV